MGGASSREEEPAVAVEEKKAVARVGEDEEKNWMDMMNRQYANAASYAKRGGPKRQTVLKLNTKIIFVVGGPGSGKGTQSARLAKGFNLVHLSVGDLLRDEAAKDTERAKLLNDYMKEGKIVPMDIVLEILRSAVEQNRSTPGILLDGFPRELEQAKEFEEKIAKPSFILHFDCSEEEMTKRLLNRGKTSGRSDDNQETIQKRLKTFVEQSVPVIDYYKNLRKVKTISSEKTPDEVYEDCRHIFSRNGFSLVDTWFEHDEREITEKLIHSVESSKRIEGVRDHTFPSSVSFPDGKKRALLVGLDYNQVNFKKNLGGSLKDVYLLQHMLEDHMGYGVLGISPASSIEVTTSNLLYALKHLVKGCGKDDHVFFYFSGHFNRIKTKDESMHEVFFTKDGGVFDFEIIDILGSFGGTYTVFVDGCNYGGEADKSELSITKMGGKGIFFISGSSTPKAKETSSVSGGACTMTLLNFLKENAFSVTLPALTECLSTSLKTLSVTFYSSFPPSARDSRFLGA